MKLSASDAKRLGIEAPKKPKGAKTAKAMAPELFKAMCVANGLHEPEPEFRFCDRKWAFDWAWVRIPEKTGHRVKWGVALEIEGGIWTQGRHTRGKGALDDMEKYNMAILLGWKLLRCTPQQIESGCIFPFLRQALGVE